MMAVVLMRAVARRIRPAFLGGLRRCICRLCQVLPRVVRIMPIALGTVLTLMRHVIAIGIMQWSMKFFILLVSLLPMRLITLHTHPDTFQIISLISCIRDLFIGEGHSR